MESRTILLLTQTFPPDPAAVGQHMADLADTLARRGHRVRVLTADRGYDDASLRYPRSETTLSGVRIRRLQHTSFGKARIIHRILALLSFTFQVATLALFERDLGAIVFSTSPPFVGLPATIVGWIRNVPLIFWAMDLNPDQLIALGKLSRNGLPATILRSVNRLILRRAAAIIALDDFMAQRLRDQAARPVSITVIPPWSPDAALTAVRRDQNLFRIRHNLRDKTVIMYSGNHSPSNPLTTLLDAAVALRNMNSLHFVFIGSGTGMREVEGYIHEYHLTNVITLPYQPKETLSDSLSAADVHVVSLGPHMTGVIHPCKVYGAMAVARPILYFGPSPSHVSAILDKCQNGWAVDHGNVDETVALLRNIVEIPLSALDARGDRGRAAMNGAFNPQFLCGSVCTTIETALTEWTGR